MDGGLWSNHNTLFLLVLAPHSFPCSSMATPHREQVLPKLLQRGSFLWATVLWGKLLQHGSPMGCREGNPCLGALSISFPLPALPWGGLQGCFSYIFPSPPHCWAVFCSSLARLSLRQHCSGCRAQPCPMVGGLRPTGTSHVQTGACIMVPGFVLYC